MISTSASKPGRSSTSQLAKSLRAAAAAWRSRRSCPKTCSGARRRGLRLASAAFRRRRIRRHPAAPPVRCIAAGGARLALRSRAHLRRCRRRAGAGCAPGGSGGWRQRRQGRRHRRCMDATTAPRACRPPAQPRRHAADSNSGRDGAAPLLAFRSAVSRIRCISAGFTPSSVSNCFMSIAEDHVELLGRIAGENVGAGRSAHALDLAVDLLFRHGVQRDQHVLAFVQIGAVQLADLGHHFQLRQIQHIRHRHARAAACRLRGCPASAGRT